jgi:hypothetical protein
LLGYLVLGGALFALVLWAGRKGLILKRREWRLLSGGLALAAFTAAAYMTLKGGWGAGIVLAVIGLWLAASARRTGGLAPPAGSRSMSDGEARAILGVAADAGPAEIKAAYARLMRSVHPDKGGTDGLAAQLNAARDRLLRS